MKINVYKGFDKYFLDNVDEEPLVEGSISDKKTYCRMIRRHERVWMLLYYPWKMMTLPGWHMKNIRL